MPICSYGWNYNSFAITTASRFLKNLDKFNKDFAGISYEKLEKNPYLRGMWRARASQLCGQIRMIYGHIGMTLRPKAIDWYGEDIPYTVQKALARYDFWYEANEEIINLTKRTQSGKI